MPNRDHDDSQYNRNEGRFEGREEQNWREQSSRGAREWDRRDDLRREGAEGPRRYESDYGGGARFGGEQDRGSSRWGGNQPSSAGYSPSGYSPAPNWFDERREAQRLGQQDWHRQQQQGGGYAQSGYSGPQQGGYRQEPQQGGYRQDWNRAPGYDWSRLQGQGYYDQDLSRPDYSRTQSNYGARDLNEPFGGPGFVGRERGRDDDSWTQQVRHAGHQFATRVKRAFRGPKGYKRSDERIREDVSERLAQQDDLDPSEIEVAVANGEVTLTGLVLSRREKFLAEEIADEVLGVNDVHVQLRIRRDDNQNVSSNQNLGTQAESPLRNRNARA